MSKSDDAVVVGRASPADCAGGDAHNPSVDGLGASWVRWSKVDGFRRRDEEWAVMGGPCFAGQLCGRGRPQPQCGWARYELGRWCSRRRIHPLLRGGRKGKVWVTG